MDVLWIWILYAALGVIIFALLFLWAVRTGQFRDQDRARRLPLEHPPEQYPPEQYPEEKEEP